jgi:MFS family permease
MTKSPVLVAGVTVAGQLPWLVFSLPAGAIADRVDRRRLVVQLELVRAAALGAFAVAVITDHRSLVALYATAFVIGACETAFWAATSACLPTIVGTETLPRANGYLLAAETSGEQFAGPALGGVVYNWQASAPFIGDALSFVASAILLIRVIPSSAGHRGDGSLLADVRFGLRWFAGNRLLRLLAAIIASFAFCQGIVLAVLVLYGLRILHLDKPGYGLFLAVGAVGNVVGGLLAGRIHARLGARWSIMAAGLVAAAGYVVLSRTSSVVVAAAGVAVQALAVSVGNVATLSLRQTVIPSELLGRVNNVFRMCVWGMLPLGGLVGGVLVSQFGLHTTFLIAGLVQVAVLILVSRRFKARMAAEPALQSSPVS